MSELNPNHPTTRVISEQWHKIAALLVQKAGGHVVISMADLFKLGPDKSIIVQELQDGIHLTIVENEMATLIASEHWGLPS